MDSGEGLPVDDGLVGALDPIPLVLRNVDEDLGLIADLFPAALDHGACVHFVVEDAPDGGLVPEAVTVFRGSVAGPAVVSLIAGWAGDASFVEHVSNALFSMAL